MNKILFNGCKDGNLYWVEFAVRNGADVNYVDPSYLLSCLGVVLNSRRIGEHSVISIIKVMETKGVVFTENCIRCARYSFSIPTCVDKNFYRQK